MDTAVVGNIGNTNSSFALWRGGQLTPGETQRSSLLRSGEWTPALLATAPTVPCVAACVVPDVRTSLEARWPQRFHWLSAELDLGVDFSRVDRRTLGADRVANAVAAANELALPAIVVDCGTALTMQLIDAERVFLGGCILPGRRLWRAALAHGTAQLPLLKLSNDKPPLLGTTTTEALRAGIDLGILGAVATLLSAYQQLLAAPQVTVLAVGGDRAFFAANLSGLTAGPADFTLRGVGWAARRLPSEPAN